MKWTDPRHCYSPFLLCFLQKYSAFSERRQPVLTNLHCLFPTTAPTWTQSFCSSSSSQPWHLRQDLGVDMTKLEQQKSNKLLHLLNLIIITAPFSSTHTLKFKSWRMMKHFFFASSHHSGSFRKQRSLVHSFTQQQQWCQDTKSAIPSSVASKRGHVSHAI